VEGVDIRSTGAPGTGGRRVANIVLPDKRENCSRALI